VIFDIEKVAVAQVREPTHLRAFAASRRAFLCERVSALPRGTIASPDPLPHAREQKRRGPRVRGEEERVPKTVDRFLPTPLLAPK
jgi:hypothetical protein